MQSILEALLQAIGLIVERNPALVEIIGFSLTVSGVALIFSTVLGIFPWGPYWA